MLTDSKYSKSQSYLGKGGVGDLCEKRGARGNWLGGLEGMRGRTGKQEKGEELGARGEKRRAKRRVKSTCSISSTQTSPRRTKSGGVKEIKYPDYTNERGEKKKAGRQEKGVFSVKSRFFVQQMGGIRRDRIRGRGKG